MTATVLGSVSLVLLGCINSRIRRGSIFVSLEEAGSIPEVNAFRRFTNFVKVTAVLRVELIIHPVNSRSQPIFQGCDFSLI